MCLTHINSFYSQIKPVRDEEAEAKSGDLLSVMKLLISQGGDVGLRGRPCQDGPLWYEHDLELKAIQTQQIQKNLFTFPSTT